MIEIGPAGIRANIEHYHSLIQAADDDLERLQDQLDFWLLTLKKTHAQEVFVSHTQG